MVKADLVKVSIVQACWIVTAVRSNGWWSVNDFDAGDGDKIRRNTRNTIRCPKKVPRAVHVYPARGYPGTGPGYPGHGTWIVRASDSESFRPLFVPTDGDLRIGHWKSGCRYRKGSVGVMQYRQAMFGGLPVHLRVERRHGNHRTNGAGP
eukprot:2351109-Rhodomonas_salina.1